MRMDFVRKRKTWKISCPTLYPCKAPPPISGQISHEKRVGLYSRQYGITIKNHISPNDTKYFINFSKINDLPFPSFWIP